MTRCGDLECKNAGYLIARERLDEQDWVSHMCEKRWVDRNAFIKAYKSACAAAGIIRVPKGYKGEYQKVSDIC